MHYSNIKTIDISNGIGVRTSLFVSGCNLHCTGCFNREAWDFNNGEEFTDDVLIDILKSLSASYVAGLSILGGEPLDKNNQQDVWKIVLITKYIYPNKDIWLWSGYTFEDLMNEINEKSNTTLKNILSNIDVLVDGPFELSQHDVMLRFKGSKNQRLLDSKASVMSGRCIEWHDIDLFEKHQWE